MKKYRYNCLNNTLTLSRMFVRQAENTDSEEYKFVKRMIVWMLYFNDPRNDLLE